MRSSIKAERLIKKIWVRVQTENPKAYSLRKVAQKAGISPAYVSLIFSRKKVLTAALAEKFIRVLKPAALEIAAIRRCFAEAAEEPNVALENLNETFLAPTTAEWLLGRWYRLPILDLLTTADFVSDEAWMATRLGISSAEVAASLDYLRREGLAHQDSEGRWQKTHAHIRFPANCGREAIRNYHRAQLKRVEEVLNGQITPKDYSQRLVIGLSAAINLEHLEGVKIELEATLYRAARKLSEGPCQEVYQINLQLIPQTKGTAS